MKTNAFCCDYDYINLFDSHRQLWLRQEELEIRGSNNRSQVPQLVEAGLEPSIFINYVLSGPHATPVPGLLVCEPLFSRVYIREKTILWLPNIFVLKWLKSKNWKLARV